MLFKKFVKNELFLEQIVWNCINGLIYRKSFLIRDLHVNSSSKYVYNNNSEYNIFLPVIFNLYATNML